MEISKFVRFHGYLSSVSLRLQMVYPNTRLSWFTRQLDLELMFTSTISLRTANRIKWEKLLILLKIQFARIATKKNKISSLALRLSSSVIREATSVWVPSRVIRVACHPTWGCSGVRKEDPGQP